MSTFDWASGIVEFGTFWVRFECRGYHHLIYLCSYLIVIPSFYSLLLWITSLISARVSSYSLLSFLFPRSCYVQSTKLSPISPSPSGTAVVISLTAPHRSDRNPFHSHNCRTYRTNSTVGQPCSVLSHLR